MSSKPLNAAAEPDAIARVAGILRDGGVVVFPTETVYGIAAAVSHPDAVKRIYAVKGRPPDKPFAVHMGSAAEVAKYVDPTHNAAAVRLAARTMPGPITILARVDDAVIDAKLNAMGLPANAKPLIYHEGIVGLRCPAHAVASELLSAVDAPVVASSANLSGDPPPNTAAAAREALGDRVDAVLDGGRTRYDHASTVVLIDGDELSIVRPGMFDEPYLRKQLMRSILFVCSGNTCRSPMAEAIARHELAERLGAPADELEAHHWQVHSAGAFAGPGAPATPEAVQAARGLGVAMPDHRSTPLSAEQVQQADVVYCMTESHRAAVAALVPDASAKAVRLNPDGDISDPIGGGADVYDRCAREIQKHIRQRLTELFD